MTINLKAIPLLVTVLCSVSGAALAQNCRAGVHQLAQQYNIAPESKGAGAEPPATAESRGLTETQRLPQSRGAFSTPSPGAPGTTSPPISSGSSQPPPSVGGMSQPPAIAPGTGALSPNPSPNLSAADRGRMEALLTAARDADRRGDSAHCIELLREAEAIPSVPGAGKPQ